MQKLAIQTQDDTYRVDLVPEEVTAVCQALIDRLTDEGRAALLDQIASRAKAAVIDEA